MKYLLTGGGTGGHVYPALAIADEIRCRQKDAVFLYVGLKTKLESWVVPKRDYPLCFVRSKPFPRSSSVLGFLGFGCALGLGVLKAMYILSRFRPDVIIGTGGYVSAPIMFAFAVLSKAGLSRAKVFAYEPNVHPGMLNQVVGGLAHRIGVAFEQAGRWFDMKRISVVGYPVRRELERLDRQEARRRLGIDPDRVVVLVLGGSGGARVINEGVVDALPFLQQRPEVLVLHVTGRYAGPDYNAIEHTRAHLARLSIEEDISFYRRVDYMENIQDGYAVADMVVCRGGAGTLTEICVCSLPALIVPLAGAPDDHQSINARELEDLGAARVLYQEAWWDAGQIRTRVEGERLARHVLALVDHPDQRHKMAETAGKVPLRNSLDIILREIEGLVAGHRPAALNLEFPLQPKGLPGNPNTLLRYVQRYLEEVGGPQALDPQERAYLRYQADRLLASEAWFEIPLGQRNVGIKLVGHLQYEQHLPLLLGILQDRKQVGTWRRLFGGDYHHGGILRRNVIEHGIRLLRIASDEVRRVLLEVMDGDPYFEVRATAAQVLGELFHPDELIEEALVKALDDRASAVVIQAIRALGCIARQPDVPASLKRFYLHSDWQFRQEVVKTLARLLEREVVCPADLTADLDQILATSPYFEPEFPLKESLRELAVRVHCAPKEQG